MDKKKDWMQAREDLRAEADRAFSSLRGADKMSAHESMLHELLVHKFELETQIEELRRTYAELEEARDRYLEYYDYAPIGYLTVDGDGRIVEINLTAAELLGLERGAGAGQRLAAFVSTRDHDRWHRAFTRMMEQAGGEPVGVVLEMARHDQTTFDAYLDCRRLQSSDDRPAVRVTLFDTGKIREAEAELQSALNNTEA